MYGHTVSRGELLDMLEVGYSLGKHWSFAASWMMMFQPKGLTYPTWNYSPVNPGEIQRCIRDNGNMVNLTVSYRGDFGSLFRKARRGLNNSDNSSSILHN